MENGTFRQSMPRLRGQWASEHCVQKVEEMLSRAIVHQEDLLGLLTSNSPDSASLDAPCTGHAMAADTIAPPVLRALKAKIENSMDWCHLALCRLREIVLHTSPASPSAQPSMGSSGGAGLLSSYSKGDAKQHNIQPSSSPRGLNVPTPLSPLRVLLRKEPLSPHPFTVQGHCGSAAAWNPGSLLFADSAPHPQLHAPGDESSQPRHPQQGQNFARLPASLHMDTSDWPLLAESGAMPGAPALPSSADPRQCSSSCQINPVVGSFSGGDGTDIIRYKTHGVAEDQSYITKTCTPTRGNRSRNIASGKSEVRKLSGGEAKLEVVFQKLNDAKKGIPDDGHRGWKKYGNKSIQNSNHCRGYYKCSVKECRAKKMVQPTDKDPTLFEVTYVGKHSCASTGQRRSRSARAAACPAVAVEAHEAQGKASAATLEDEWMTKRGAMAADAPGSILTGSTSMTDGSTIMLRQHEWTGIPVADSSRAKRGRSAIHPGGDEDDRASLDTYSYLHTMTTSTTTSTAPPAPEPAGDGGDASMDTYLHQSSRHHQAVYAFQEPLLWHDFDMDTATLSTAPKSTLSMASDSP